MELWADTVPQAHLKEKLEEGDTAKGIALEADVTLTFVSTMYESSMIQHCSQLSALLPTTAEHLFPKFCPVDCCDKGPQGQEMESREVAQPVPDSSCLLKQA